MRKVLLLSILICLVGCSNLIKKQVRVVSSTNGGKISTIDLVGSGTPTPQIIAGNNTTIITTVPPNTIGHFKTTTFQFWSSYPAVIDETWIDTTKDPVDVRYLRTFFSIPEGKKEK